MTSPKIAVSVRKLIKISFGNTPKAAQELCGHPEKYKVRGHRTALAVSEEAAQELEHVVGGIRLERS